MKTFFKRILPFIVVITLVLSFVGCGNNNKPNNNSSKALSIVVGGHKYFPAVPLSSKNIYDRIYDTAYANGRCYVVVSDGSPFLYSDYSIDGTDKSIDNAKRKMLAKQNTSQIIVESEQAYAKTPEFDTLAAISKSAGCLNSSGAATKTLLVCDSGFSTCGLLDFKSSNLINADVDKLISELNNRHAIPDLNGIEVIWFGLGEVSGEQSKLTSEYKYKLANIWKSILEAGGAMVTIDSGDIGSLESQHELPNVSTIPIVENGINVENMVNSDLLKEPIKFDESTVKFVGDSDEYIDKSTAINSLKPIADYLVSNPTVNIIVLGTTASSGSEDGCLSLSEKRAAKCKNTLVELGANTSQITCKGLGKKPNPLRIDDLDVTGNLVESYAVQNRAIYIFNTNSKYLQEIL